MAAVEENMNLDDNLLKEFDNLKDVNLKNTKLKLNERIKELECLYFTSKLVQNDKLSIEQILQRLAAKLPSYLKYPEHTAAEINYQSKQYISDGFKRSRFKLENDIRESGEKRGSIAVFLSAEDGDNKDFLTEEKYLLRAISTIISREIERRRAVKSIEQMSADNKILLDNIDIQVWYLMDAETYGAVNKAHAEYLGMSKEELEHKKIGSVISDKFGAENYIKSNQCVFENGEKISKRLNIIKNDGEKRIMEITKIPRLNRDGNVDYVVCTAQDITDQEMQKKQLEMTQFSVDKSDLLIFSATPEGTITYANETALNVLGFEPNNLIGLDAVEFLEEKEYEKRDDFWQKIKRNGSINYERTIVSKDGKKIPLEIISHYFNQGDEEYEFVFAQDISARKEAEIKLKEQLNFNQMLADISSYFVRLPAESLLKRINYALKKIGEFYDAESCYLLKFAEADFKKRKLYQWSRIDDKNSSKNIDETNNFKLKNLKEKLKTNSYIDFSSADGHFKENIFKEFMTDKDTTDFAAVRLLNENEIFGVLFVERDRELDNLSSESIRILKLLAELITNAFARYRDNRKINHLTFHDGLTDLYNRKFVKEEMRRLDVKRMLPMSIIMADINGLKIFNDNYGHNTGDKLITKAAEILKENIREEDILARWGGDEFIIFLPKSTKKEVELIIKRFKKELSLTENCPIPVSLALGYAIKNDIEDDIDEVINRADSMMYKDKKENGVKFKNKILRNK